MTHELAVLFQHHANDATTRNNLAAVRRSNPDVPIVPITTWGVTLPGGFNCRHMTAGWRRLLPSFRGGGIRRAWRRCRFDFDRTWIWRNCDLIAYLWVQWPRRPIRAKRWVIFEWDMYCNANLLEWYAPNFEHCVVATSLQLPGRNDDFPYFTERENRTIPEPIRSYRMATNPWAGMMFSEEALGAIADRVRTLRYCNGFAEVRVATTANSLGLTPQMNGNPLAQQTLRSVTDFDMTQIRQFAAKSVFHRVKRNDLGLAAVSPTSLHNPG